MSTMDRLAAALADRYRIERELGQGGMATVYLAQDLKHDRQVAIKVLRPELAAVIGAERFLSEIKTTANLQHPHILPLFDSGIAHSTEAGPEAESPSRRVAEFLFYVMPFIEGESLRDRLTREKQLPITDVVRIASEVASALDYAHRHGVIHRDIKPENVLLHDGQALVADFGIALAASKAGGSRMTETGMSLGTPHYMSPEQAMGEREITARSDVYALGAMTYEMLVGEPPFTGPTAQAIVAKVLSSAPARPTESRKSIPPELEDAVLTALEKLPADRFGSAAEFAAALTGETGGRRVVGRRTSRPGTTLSRRAAAILVLTALIAGAAGGRLIWSRAREPAQPLVRFSLPVKLGDIDFGPGLDISSDGSQLVFIGKSSDGRPGLYRRVLAKSDAALIPGTEGNIVRAPTLSPDGQLVAFTTQAQLRVVSLRGGGDRVVVEGVSPTSGGLDWVGDSIVFQRNFGEGLMLVSAQGGSARALTRLDPNSKADHRWPQVTPDGKSVIFTVWNGSPPASRIAIASMRTGEIRDLLAGMFGRYSNGHLVYIAANQSMQRVAFDPKTGRVQGEPVALADSVWVGSDGAAQFAVSGTGTLAYLHSLGLRAPVLVNREGVATPLSGVPPDLYLSPRLSPDGRFFAMEQGTGDIWAYAFASQTFSRITDGGGFYAVWTRDGSRILYSRDEQAEVNVYSVPLDRSEGPRTVLAHQGQQRTQDLSHDGKHLLLRQNRGTGQYDLMVMRLDSSSSLSSWLSTDFLERAPSFSPNDRWVAYSSDESGREEVYVRPFPGPGGRIPVSSGGGTEPAWSPNGRELFYRTDAGLEVVQVESGPGFRVLSRPRTLFQGGYFAYPWARQYDILPDGTRFLFLRNETPITDLRVVLNWSRTVTSP